MSSLPLTDIPGLDVRAGWPAVAADGVRGLLTRAPRDGWCAVMPYGKNVARWRVVSRVSLDLSPDRDGAHALALAVGRKVGLDVSRVCGFGLDGGRFYLYGKDVMLCWVATERASNDSRWRYLPSLALIDPASPTAEVEALVAVARAVGGGT